MTSFKHFEMHLQVLQHLAGAEVIARTAASRANKSLVKGILRFLAAQQMQ